MKHQPQPNIELQDFVEQGLRYLGTVIAHKYNQGNPCGNEGGFFQNEVFSMRSFYWGDDEAVASLPNFKCGEFEATWYKYLGRSSTQSDSLTFEQWQDIFTKCYSSLK